MAALAQVNAGDLDGAQATFAALPTNLAESAMRFTRALAAAKALSGDVQGGYDMLSAVGVDYYEGNLIDLMRHQAATGDIRGATSAVKRLRTIAARSPAYRAIALVQIAQGDLPGARKTATRIPDPALRATVLAAAGDPSEAQTLAATLTDPAQRAWALALSGQLDQALALADPATSPEAPLASFQETLQSLESEEFIPHGNAYLRVIGALSQTRHYDQALGLAAALSSPRDRDFARSDIARAAAQANDFALAIQICNTMEDPTYARAALVAIRRAVVFTLRDP